MADLSSSSSLPHDAAVVAASPAKPSSVISPQGGNNDDLVSIHRQALAKISASRRQHPESKAEQLRLLRRKRIQLACQVYERQQKGGRTVGEELRQRNRTRKQTTTTTLHNVLEEQDLALRMKEIRHARKIAAAYRLAGITLWPCPDKDVLALRLDVAVEGIFVACYHCFFDLCCCKDDNKLYLRLVQHTLPPSVPLGSILEKTLGGVALVGSLNESSWRTSKLMERLRTCANELYQACYCFCVRKQAVAFLQQAAVRALECTDTLGKISFEMVVGVSSLQVTLAYKDPLRVQPTHVSVKNLVASTSSFRNPRTYASVEISDDDDDSAVDDDLAENAIISFRRLPMRKAVEEVSEAMADW